MLYPRDNDVHITFIVQHNTHNNRYFMLNCENEQFHLLGPFSLNALVKRVSEIYWQDDCINDGKKHLSYSLLCSSALSNEERKNILHKRSVHKNVFIAACQNYGSEKFSQELYLSVLIYQKKEYMLQNLSKNWKISMMIVHIYYYQYTWPNRKSASSKHTLSGLQKTDSGLLMHYQPYS